MTAKLQRVWNLKSLLEERIAKLAGDICTIYNVQDHDRRAALIEDFRTLLGTIPNWNTLNLSLTNQISVITEQLYKATSLEGQTLNQRIWSLWQETSEELKRAIEPYQKDINTLFNGKVAADCAPDPLQHIDNLKNWLSLDLYGESKSQKEARQTLAQVSQNAADNTELDLLNDELSQISDVDELRKIALYACQALKDSVSHVCKRAETIEKGGYGQGLDIRRAEGVKSLVCRVRGVDEDMIGIRDQIQMLQTWVDGFSQSSENSGVAWSDESVSQQRFLDGLDQMPATMLSGIENIRSALSNLSKEMDVELPDPPKKGIPAKQRGGPAKKRVGTAAPAPAVDRSVELEEMKKKAGALLTELNDAKSQINTLSKSLADAIEEKRKICDYFMGEQDRITDVFRRYLVKEGLHVPEEVNTQPYPSE